MNEVERTLAKPYFMQRLEPELTHRFLTLLRRTSILQPISEPVYGVATHSEDDWILATTNNAHAQFLVTCDKALQALEWFESVRVIDPASFAQYLINDE